MRRAFFPKNDFGRNAFSIYAGYFWNKAEIASSVSLPVIRS